MKLNHEFKCGPSVFDRRCWSSSLRSKPAHRWSVILTIQETAMAAESLPIVLVPGLGSSVRAHLGILPALWRHGSLFVANHIRDDTIEALARRILAEAPAPNFSLIGHSFGGYIVLEMMRQAPQRVTRLLLMNTQARTDSPQVTERRKATIAMINRGFFEEAMEADFPLLVHPSHIDDEWLKEQMWLTRRDTGPDVYLRHQAAIMGRKDSRPYLKDILVPTLVLTGDEDRLISNEFSREMADAIPSAVLEIVAQCGHMSPMEQSEAVIDAMDQWLAR
jgi:pimeloyl-ACP methyl ester carboxylesterase